MKLGITRLDFLRGAIASLATAAVSPSRAADAIAQLALPPAARLAPSLLDLEFSIVEQFRPFDLLPEGFV
jgi:hypothetical protein